MKNLSLNIKKIALSLLIVGLVVGTQAFTRAEESVRLTYFYGNSGSGVYIQISAADADPDVNCRSTDPNPCILTSDQDVPAGFTLGSPAEPTDAEPVSERDALWFN